MAGMAGLKSTELVDGLVGLAFGGITAVTSFT